MDTSRTREVIAAADVEIDVIVEGTGPLVVLLPSRGRDSYDYDEVAEGLAHEGFRVLRPQPRGIGASRGPMTGITLHDFANDIAAVIRHYGDAAVLVGHAYGNWVARMTATDHPDLGARRGDRGRGLEAVSAGAEHRGRQERRPVAAAGRAAAVYPVHLLRARPRRLDLARRLASGGERSAAHRRRRHQAVGMVGDRHGRRSSTCRPTAIRFIRSGK